MSVSVPVNARGPIVVLTLPTATEQIDVVLRNNTTGKQLTLNLPAEWDGDDITLDFHRRTITDQTGADRSPLLDPEDNDLWLATDPIVAGENDVEIEALTEVLSQTKSPGGVADNAGIGNKAWSNPENAKATDNSYATVALEGKAGSSDSHYLLASKYGFTLPASAVIVGIEANVERKANVEKRITDKKVQLVKGGVVQTPDKGDHSSNRWPISDEAHAYGGSSDLWENTWTQAQVNAEGFGLAVACSDTSIGQSSTGSVDYMPLTVYYRKKIAFVAKAVLSWEQGYY